jgi:hypothetical protein
MATNIYKQFLRLIPTDPLQVGDVQSITDGEAVIVLPGGGTIRARGQADVGDRVWVRAGLIEGPAPVLPVEIFEI